MGNIQTSKPKAKKFEKEGVMKIEQEIKKAIEQLTAGSKIQLELDRKNNCLKIWKLNLKKIEIKDGIK